MVKLLVKKENAQLLKQLSVNSKKDSVESPLAVRSFYYNLSERTIDILHKIVFVSIADRKASKYD